MAEVRGKMTPASKDFLEFSLIMESDYYLRKGRPGFAMVVAIDEERLALLKEKSKPDAPEVRWLKENIARLKKLAEDPRLLTADPKLAGINRIVPLSEEVSRALKKKDVRGTIDPLKQIVETLKNGMADAGPQEAKKLGMPAQTAEFLKALAMAQEHTGEAAAADASRKDLLAVLSNAYGPDHWRTREAEAESTSHRLEAALPPKAHQQYDEAIQLTREADGERRKGHFRKSAELTRAARDQIANLFRRDDAAVYNLTVRLAGDLKKAGNFPAAEQEFLKALKLGHELLGDHPVVASATATWLCFTSRLARKTAPRSSGPPPSAS